MSRGNSRIFLPSRWVKYRELDCFLVVYTAARTAQPSNRKDKRISKRESTAELNVEASLLHPSGFKDTCTSSGRANGLACVRFIVRLCRSMSLRMLRRCCLAEVFYVPFTIHVKYVAVLGTKSLWKVICERGCLTRQFRRQAYEKVTMIIGVV